MTRAQIERLGEEGGGLGRQEVSDLLALHDAYARMTTLRRVAGGLMMACVAVLLYLICSAPTLADRWASSLFIKASSLVVSIVLWKFLFDVVRDRRRVAGASLADPGRLSPSGQAPDGMGDNHDFGGASRGKFFRPGYGVITRRGTGNPGETAGVIVGPSGLVPGIPAFDAGPIIPGVSGDRVLRALLAGLRVSLDMSNPHTLFLRRWVAINRTSNVQVDLAIASRTASPSIVDQIDHYNGRMVSEAIIEIALGDRA